MQFFIQKSCIEHIQAAIQFYANKLKCTLIFKIQINFWIILKFLNLFEFWVGKFWWLSGSKNSKYFTVQLLEYVALVLEGPGRRRLLNQLWHFEFWHSLQLANLFPWSCNYCNTLSESNCNRSVLFELPAHLQALDFKHFDPNTKIQWAHDLRGQKKERNSFCPFAKNDLVINFKLQRSVIVLFFPICEEASDWREFEVNGQDGEES